MNNSDLKNTSIIILDENGREIEVDVRTNSQHFISKEKSVGKGFKLISHDEKRMGKIRLISSPK